MSEINEIKKYDRKVLNFNFGYKDPSTCSEVNEAAKDGNISKLKSLLSAGKSPNVKDNRGWVAIHFAVDGGKLEVIKLLLGRDDVNANAETYDGLTPLLMTFKHFGPRQSLFRSNGRSCQEKLLQITELLLEFGADPNSKLKHPFMTPLAKAVSMNFPMLVTLLIDKGANINDGDDHFVSPFHAAVDKDVDTMVMLDILFRHDLPKPKFICKPCSPLHALLAVTRGMSENIHVLKRLLLRPESYAIINTKDFKGNTPLAIACKRMNLEAIEMLLDFGADPNIRNDDNEIPLVILIKECSLHLKRYCFQTIDRLLDITCKSEIKKSRFIDQMFYEYLIITQKTEMLKSSMKWFPDLINVSCNIHELVCLYRHDPHHSIDVFKSLKSYLKASLLTTACLACTNEDGFTIVKLILELGCPVNVNTKEYLAPIIVASLDRFPESREYSTKLAQLLIDNGADIEIRASRRDPFSKPIFFAMNHCFSVDVLKVILFEIDVMAVCDQLSIYSIEKYFSRRYWHENATRELSHEELFLRLLLTMNKFLTSFPIGLLSRVFTNFQQENQLFRQLKNVVETPKRLSYLCSLEFRKKIFQIKPKSISMSRLIDQVATELKLPRTIVQHLRLEGRM